MDLTSMLVRHEPGDDCIDVHCHSCDLDHRGPAFRRCGECGHAYATARELRLAYRWEPYIGPFTWFAALLTPTSRIKACPMCGHSF